MRLASILAFAVRPWEDGGCSPPRPTANPNFRYLSITASSRYAGMGLGLACSVGLAGSRSGGLKTHITRPRLKGDENGQQWRPEDHRSKVGEWPR